MPKKFTVADMLTIGKQYDVINETEEYYQIIDNSGLVGGYYKDYFKEIQFNLFQLNTLSLQWIYFSIISLH